MAKSRYHITNILLVLSLFFSQYVSADAKRLEELKLEVYSLKTSATSITDVQQYTLNEWKKAQASTVYLSPHEGNSWVLIALTNSNEKDVSRLLELANPKIPSVTVYNLETFNDKNVAKMLFPELGLDTSFSSRPIKYRNLIYPVELDANSTQFLLLNFKHTYSFKLNTRIWTKTAFQNHTSQELVFFGMIYGALFMIAMYNFFIYLSLREKSHLLFVLFGTFTGLFVSMQEGHFSQFVVPDSLWPKDIFFAIVSALMSFCFTFFCIYFLDIERWSNLLFRFMLVVGSAASLTLIFLGISPETMIFSHYVLSIIILLYAAAIGVGLFVWHNGVSTAGFFSLAIFLCNLGLFVDFAMGLTFVPDASNTYSYSSIGNAAMIMVFAFALADKMRVLQEEKLSASMKLVKMTEEKAQSNLEVYKTKLHEVELEQEASKAKIESRAKSEFLATMSHEIRTPMNGVLGMTELLSDTELDKHQRHHVDTITNSAKALLNVINDLLDYSKLQSGKMELDAKVFNLEKVIDDCISIFALRASESKINFIGQLSPETGLQYKGDADKIRQIILNLLANAFNLPSCGDIRLNAFATSKNTVNSVEIRFEIKRDGIVISEEDRTSLFAPFHENGNKRKTHSQELGLTVSRELVELMQGDIGVDTDEENTTLWFTIRLLLPHSDERLDLPDRTKILGGRRLLICDDNQTFIDSIIETTEAWGMEATYVNTAKDVSEKLLHDDNAYQILMIAEECLTPEVQFSVRQSNVDHNFTTSIIMVTKSRFAISKEDMKKRGIQYLLETPYTTSFLYKSLLKSMGISSNTHKEHVHQKDLSILIAEDNNVNQMVIDGLLKKFDFTPVLAANGVEATDAYQNHEKPFDLIFMDCEMPELDGYEATSAIRHIEEETEHKSVIIGLSAHTTPEYKDKAMTAGMDDFIVKPVNSEDIETIIQKVNEGHFHTETDSSNAFTK